MFSLSFKNCILALCLVSFCCPSVLSLVGDSEILVSVKNGQLDDRNGKLNDWVSGTDQNPCKWTGITCDNQNQTVISINLSGLGIGGGFPSGFCRIRTLQNLSLADNSFNGTLTSRALSPCSRLHVLDLSSNLFVGELPDFSPEFRNLRVLVLSSNNFTGDIPVSFGNFPSLEILTLSQNLLTGTAVPGFLANLTKLTQLELAYNPFKPSSLPKDFGNLTKLENLFLTSTNLIGEIPESIGKLSSLYNLDLSCNSITGKIPDTISGLKSIFQIELYDNQLYGELPESLSNLTTLIQFDASQNNLTGILPDKIAALPLKSFFLNDNNFIGEIPDALALNPNLMELHLFNNSFTGKLPANLGRYSDLVDFDVSTNDFSGDLPKYLCYRKRLEKVIAFQNRFSGNLPLGECSSLSYVRIADNEFSGIIPSNLWGFPNLSRLELSYNKFEGPISPLISGARRLSSLLLSGNNFSGKLPAEICTMDKLLEINLSNNQFVDELPQCITALKKLQKLNLQENMFSGEIPLSVSSWVDLSELNLSRNQLSGYIPALLGHLPVLTSLDLADNKLTGEIPAELTKLKLAHFNVSDNRLYGKIPSGFATSVYFPSLAGNPNLCSPDLKPIPPCSKPKPKPIALYIIAILAICALILLGSFVWFSKARSVFVRKPKRLYKVIPFQRVRFNEEDIFPCLTKENLIGSGRSGQVYRAKLKTGQIVAVKRLWAGGEKLETESVFRSEVETLGRVRHSNIVKLLMCCSGEEFKFLVYEFMENGSLGDVLHGEKGGDLLDWPCRFAVAVGAAQGLAYLHHDCVPPILHRDVKSNNILLDEEMRPRVADFGFAKTLQNEAGGGEATVMSRIAGSYGYIAPEYAYTLKVTEKSDVYSYGVVLMELITGKRPNDSCFGENKDLVKWVSESTLCPSSKGENENGKDVVKIIDTRMNSPTLDYEEVERVLHVALLCTSSFPINRPSMRRVVELLKDKKFTPTK